MVLLYGYVVELLVEVCCGELIAIGRRPKQSKVATLINIKLSNDLHQQSNVSFNTALIVA